MIKKFLIALVILLWVGVLLSALWWYNTTYIRTEFFAGQELHLPQDIAGPGRIRLVHFWDPSCPCNLGNQQHLGELTRDYADSVDFYHMQMPSSNGHLPKTLNRLKPIKIHVNTDILPASPAVAIWDEFGQLAYFGPYSEGAICNSSNSFVEPVLEALKQGRSVLSGSNLAAGCFCTWQPSP